MPQETLEGSSQVWLKTWYVDTIRTAPLNASALTAIRLRRAVTCYRTFVPYCCSAFWLNSTPKPGVLSR